MRRRSSCRHAFASYPCPPLHSSAPPGAQGHECAGQRAGGPRHRRAAQLRNGGARPLPPSVRAATTAPGKRPSAGAHRLCWTRPRPLRCWLPETASRPHARGSGLPCACLPACLACPHIAPPEAARRTHATPPPQVKYFCNEGFELAGYDTATRKYQVRAPRPPLSRGSRPPPLRNHRLPVCDGLPRSPWPPCTPVLPHSCPALTLAACADLPPILLSARPPSTGKSCSSPCTMSTLALLRCLPLTVIRSLPRMLSPSPGPVLLRSRRTAGGRVLADGVPLPAQHGAGIGGLGRHGGRCASALAAMRLTRRWHLVMCWRLAHHQSMRI